MGASGIPNTGMAQMFVVLPAFGLPASDIAYILTVDWFL